jgi:hypothetical protein
MGGDAVAVLFVTSTECTNAVGALAGDDDAVNVIRVAAQT